MASEDKHTEKFEDLCAGYVLNALQTDERKEFETMLRDASEEQRQLFLDLRSAAGQLAFSMERSEPPAGVKKHILERIRSGGTGYKDKSDVPPIPSDEYHESKSSDDRSYFAIAASFALLIISLSLLFYSFSMSRRLGDREEIIENQQARITTLQGEIRQKEELLSILESRQIDMVHMTGMEACPNGYGKIIWAPERDRAFLQVSNLPAVPSGKDYQLWIIKNNRHISAGVFAIHDPGKDTFFKIEQMEPADDQSTNAFAVTLEPEGGMPQPTGDMYLMGNMDAGPPSPPDN